MTGLLSEDVLKREGLKLELQRIEELELAREHPAFLLHHVQCVDSRSGEVFEFELFNDADRERLAEIGIETRGTGWYWQREVLDWIIENDQTIMLKGRQLGVTWISAGLALWYLLYKPGSDVLIYSITEDDAIEVIGRIWDMLESVRRSKPGERDKSHLMNGATVIRPSRDGTRPSQQIEVQHEDGRVSSITAMPATQRAGHGRSAALVIFDEASRQDYARQLWKAVVPAAGDKGGKIVVISTANGMSDTRSGEGNFFHHLWVNAGTSIYPRLQQKFLGWWLHPDRDDNWYANVGLDGPDRAEQYPNDPDEAFLMSGSPFLDVESLKWYTENDLIAKPIMVGEFEPDPKDPSRARFVQSEGGCIEVYERPRAGGKYGLAADTATGHGADYSVGALIDLSSGAPVAELRMKDDYDAFARQLHFLGKWFNTARLAPENAGGYGDTVIAYLRDGHEGRKPYEKMYRFRRFNRPDRVESATFGFPMNQATRPKVTSELKIWVKDRLFPYVTRQFMNEARTFVRRDTRPSPRAADGTNDDVVMAWGIALQLYAEFGEHEHDRRKKRRNKPKTKKPATSPFKGVSSGMT